MSNTDKQMYISYSKITSMPIWEDNVVGGWLQFTVAASFDSALTEQFVCEHSWFNWFDIAVE